MYCCLCLTCVWHTHEEKREENVQQGSQNMFNIIGPFRVHLSLHFKARLSETSLLWKSVFIHIETGTNYHNKISLLDLLWKRDLGKLGNGLLCSLPCKARFSPKCASTHGEIISNSLMRHWAQLFSYVCCRPKWTGILKSLQMLSALKKCSPFIL